MSVWLGLYFQDSCSCVMEHLLRFHDHTMVILVVVMILVGYLLICSCYSLYYSSIHYSAHILESVWTFVPIVLLMAIAFPSLRLLYLMEEVESSELSMKVVGHQWYWSYEYSDFLFGEFDSYLLSDEPLFRLLMVDNKVVLPILTSIRMVVTSDDVIHSWTLPSVGVSTDAIPGRLNQIVMLLNRMGMFVGQCSEICGLNHSFMPVVIEAMSRGDFLSLE